MKPIFAKKKRRKKGLWVIGLIILVIILGGWYGSSKQLPEGISIDSDWTKAEEIEFLYDLTYQVDDEKQQEQRIFEKARTIIDEAESFLIVDMFLFNDDYDRKFSFPSLSKDFAQRLAAKKKNNPQMKIAVITDEINTFYGVYESESIHILKEAGIPVVITELDALRNSNTMYSGFYGLALKWFGTEGKGWIQNPFSASSPEVTLRSYLRLVNFKANHRKTLVSEKEMLVSSANPHDASSNHSNIAFAIKGDLISVLKSSEEAVMAFSGYEETFPDVPEMETGSEEVKLITEGQIRTSLVEAMDQSQKGDQIRMGMFYLSERSIIKALIDAVNRGVDVQLILDANKDAFGLEKNGIPNRPVASEMKSKTNDQMAIRWYETHGEQFHTKLTMIHYEAKDEVLLFGGSANLTRRNISDFNLETDVCVRTQSGSDLHEEVTAYFDRIWSNEEGQYTLDYSAFQEDTLWKKVIYRIQEYTGLSTF